MSKPGWLRGDGVIIVICFIAMAIIFMVDIETAPGISVSMLYLLPVTLAFRVERIWHLYFIALVATALTLIAAPLKPSGEVIFLAINRPLSVGITWLVTYMGAQRRKDEQAREELLHKLERTTGDLRYSNEELQQFAYVASHDLREPLRMVSGYMALLEKKYSDSLDERGKEYVRFAMDGAVRMDSLIVDLLAYSRAGTAPIDLQQIDLNEVAKSALRNLSPAIEESHAHIQIAPLPTVAADKTQMLQLFQNLLGNAIKYHGDEEPRITMAATDKGNEWELAVQDNGIGVPPEQQGRLFQMFMRLHTREEYEGTGIGLALAKRIVERHGGHIWIESDGKSGSTFRFTLDKALRPSPETKREERSSKQG
jgi:signal transduction histidine kinase